MTRIAVSRASGSPKYLMYEQWLKHYEAELDSVDLWDIFLNAGPDEALRHLESCDGLLLTGGSDIHPMRYDKADEVGRCHVDEHRDNLEFALVEHARSLALPLLGVCRGAQLLNVAYGGSLVIDIPSDRPGEVVHSATNEADSYHDIEIEGGSLLKRITRLANGSVNSAHHQAVLNLASDFVCSASAPDGIVEAFESSAVHGQSSVLAVQWHPERMDYENAFSAAIARHFIFESMSYAQLLKKSN